MRLHLVLLVSLVFVALFSIGVFTWLWGGFGGGVKPGVGVGVPPPDVGPEEDGPWNHRLLIAFSEDGRRWLRTYRVLSDQASVPDVIIDSKGRIRVYYADYYNLGVILAISRDGERWRYIRVKGLNASWVDPDVVLLPDGRYRLYASYMPLHGPQDRILSAISRDGIHFKVEAGCRYHQPGRLVVDPDVFYFQGRWYMIIGPRLTLLESEDGLTFTLVGDLPLEGAVSSTIIVDGRLRIYYHRLEADGRLHIYMAETRDLKEWSVEQVLPPGPQGSLDAYGVGDPAVAELPDGGYIMIYKTWIEPPPWISGG
ncbi:hypothetical protein DRO49_02810 [Candidatus Bathyarchaeota archaeon]|nr:MAG: hypothetical protein DRO49_02810 [Candidatus Bathyarchaeota archaeon]